MILDAASAPCMIAWVWLDQHVPTLWSVLRAISPYPRLTQPLPLVSWISWLGWGFGVALLGMGLRHRGPWLWKNTAMLREKLRQQAFKFQLGRSRVANSEENYSRISETKKILTRGADTEDKRWWMGPVGLMIIGVCVNVVSHFIYTNDLTIFSIMATLASVIGVLFQHVGGYIHGAEKASLVIENKEGRKISLEFDPSEEESVRRLVTELGSDTQKQAVD